MSLRANFRFGLLIALLFAPLSVRAADSMDWPPQLKVATNATLSTRAPRLLDIPEGVQSAAKKEGAAEFEMAKTPPTVEVAFHGQLGTDAASRRLWSSWGDICVASDGSVYVGLGDHGNDVGGDARCFLYRWNPKRKLLEQVVDMNRVVPPANGQPAWSKIHAKIDEGPDGQILFCCTLNDGNRAKLPTHKWNEQLPGGQIYAFDPKTGQTSVFANLPPKRCTATSLVDRQRGIWWCNLEAGDGNALWGLSLKTKEPVFQSAEGAIAFNRNFALAQDGSIFFNGEGGIWRYDPTKNEVSTTKSAFPSGPGMRCTTRESKGGEIYGITHQTNRLFVYRPKRDELKMLGPNWLSGSYTAVCELSPDEKYVYYLPGAHGSAFKDGTPVVQYEIATGKKKALAFLAPAIEVDFGYVPAGTYGIKLSADGGTLYANLNGHPADAYRPAKMKPNGFGLCSFVAIQIPASER